MEDKCVPHQKYHSVEPSGNDLLTCGNPTQPASLVTTTSPQSHHQRYSTPQKITAVAMAADLFVTSLWEHPGMRHRASGSDG